MGIFRPEERVIASCIGELNYINPFSSDRVTLEKKILGSSYRDIGPLWSDSPAGIMDSRVNQKQISEITSALVKSVDSYLQSGTYPDDDELEIYEGLIVYYLFEKYRTMFSSALNSENPTFSFFREFSEDVDYFLFLPGNRILPCHYTAVHLFSMFFQVHRAFYFIFKFIIGTSEAAGALRCSIWESIFTCDIKRYQHCLYSGMREFSTLITGPSGTGKELVARAVAYCSYIPFSHTKYEFAVDYRKQFIPLHLAAMPGTLIESELFGHMKGAFTGAVKDRSGWLESVSRYGTVFLDEIGEISEEIQVKLLRVIQDRTFQRIGGQKELEFKGKIIAATNRDLYQEMQNGSFREDLYYRLCSDKINTPMLCDLIDGSSKELKIFLKYIALKIFKDYPDEAERLASESYSWIMKHLGIDYKWPGNVRELEQCVRNILLRGYYLPVLDKAPGKLLSDRINSGELTADELLAEYCSIVYSRTGSYVETAKILNLDRRTVKSKIDYLKS
jgi:hypothetical protein